MPNNVYNNNELLNNPLFNTIINSLTPKKTIIICLRLGFINNKCLSTEEIAKMFNIDEDEIRVIVRQTLQLYQEKINDYINNIRTIAIDEEYLAR